MVDLEEEVNTWSFSMTKLSSPSPQCPNTELQDPRGICVISHIPKIITNQTQKVFTTHRLLAAFSLLFIANLNFSHNQSTLSKK